MRCGRVGCSHGTGARWLGRGEASFPLAATVAAADELQRSFRALQRCRAVPGCGAWAASWGWHLRCYCTRAFRAHPVKRDGHRSHPTQGVCRLQTGAQQLGATRRTRQDAHSCRCEGSLGLKNQGVGDPQVAKNEKVLARPAADPPFRRPFGFTRSTNVRLWTYKGLEGSYIVMHRSRSLHCKSSTTARGGQTTEGNCNACF